MNFAIIAAGEGSRLQQEGVATPKPLVKIDGQPMIGRLIDIFISCGAETVSVIVNEQMTEVRQYLESLAPTLPVELRLVVKTTPSSMHSFYEVSKVLPEGKYILTTVDTIFRADDFRRYAAAFAADETADGFMAVTTYIDDEKPLYVETAADMRITAFRDEPFPGVEYISAGIYGLGPAALKVLDGCMEQGVARMRNFQRALIADGLDLRAFNIGKVIDVDHQGDIEKANAFVKPRPRIAAISRSQAYSPNHVSTDSAILNATANCLKDRGFNVTVYSEEDLRAGKVSEPVIVNMCREAQTISELQRLEKEDGRTVVNSAFSIANCTREPMTRMLLEGGIPYPESLIVGTDDDVIALLEDKGFTRCWIKRGDHHTTSRDDVWYVRHAAEAQQVLKEYSLRGIRRAVINRHIDGDLIKFYGVAGTDFFHWFYPYDDGHSKYGQEAVNGLCRGLPFDVESLKELCHRAADILGVAVYGGDCIVGADGSICIIDFNDWPSFAPCCEAAAPHIADCIEAAANKSI